MSERTDLPSIQYYRWPTEQRGTKVAYECAYEIWGSETAAATPLLLIHPIGVGLDRCFWHRFNQAWQQSEPGLIYNPDLLGCGASDMPALPYTPQQWAEQLRYFLTEVVKQPVVLVAQGALFPVALALAVNPEAQPWLRGLVFSGPPSWSVITQAAAAWQQQTLWQLFRSPLGAAFYRYARREEFLASFSVRQLFGEAAAVDQAWLDMLHEGSRPLASRHAVFAFLAGFWRQNYQPLLGQVVTPTLTLVGEAASSISRQGKQEGPQERLERYGASIPNSQGQLVPGRNVLPYESTAAFCQAVATFREGLP